jgi:hypothetical protein
MWKQGALSECKEEGRFQLVIVGEFTENSPYMDKIRFETESKELGFLRVPTRTYHWLVGGQ